MQNYYTMVTMWSVEGCMSAVCAQSVFVLVHLVRDVSVSLTGITFKVFLFSFLFKL